jgi:hypothetical protein
VGSQHLLTQRKSHRRRHHFDVHLHRADGSGGVPAYPLTS